MGNTNPNSKTEQDDYNFKLEKAAKDGDLAKVKYFVELHHADVNASKAYALQLAVENEHFNVVKYLVSHEAKINPRRILFDAIKTGNLEIVKYLIKHGADIHADNGYALRIATEKGFLNIVKYLYEHGVRRVDALPYAALEGHSEIVKYLIKNGENVHTKDDLAIIWAAMSGHLDIVIYLLDNDANPAVQNNRAIKTAANEGHVDIVAFLFQDSRVREAGLPMPDFESEDPLAHMLVKILGKSRWKKFQSQK